MMRSLAILALLCLAAPALAQLRTVPPDTKRGVMRHLQDMTVQIDQSTMRLAPGALIRDIHNRLVLPMAIPPGSVVKYRVDAQGQIARVWILTAEEAAASAPPPAPKPAPKPVPAKPAGGATD
ncbi:MAG TPA: hypothetical protein VJ789_09120 [Burkholderiales bacterium]|nr:hypothetical protein [Burkholderiales bacterium]